MSRIFDLFLTSKPVGQGASSWLDAQLQQRVQHNSHVEVESVPGHGVRFHIRQPVRHIEAPAEQAHGSVDK